MKERLRPLIYFIIPLLLLGLNLFLINKAEFLFNWDERFHALVAKNLLSDPSITRLLPPEFNSDVETSGHAWSLDPIWLHKPPLFSYVEALFMKIFGLGVFQFRLASAFSLVLIYFSLLRIQILAGGPRLVAALIATGICVNPFLLKLMMGWQGMDHNDLAFITYVSLGIWAVISYHKKGGFGRLFLISLAVAAAILTKWLTGLLPFLFWFLILLKAGQWTKIRSIFISFLISIAFIAPWQILIHLNYKDRALSAAEFNSRHFTEVIEGHSHPWFYHFEQWGTHFFLLLALILLGALFNRKHRVKLKSEYQFAALGSIAFVMVFFSLAQTKLPAFTFINLPLIAILLASISRTNAPRVYFALGFLVLSIAQMAYLPFVNMKARFPEDQKRYEFYQGLNLKEKSVIIGARDFHQVEAMFYSRHLILDNSLEQWYLASFKEQAYPIYKLVYNQQGQELGLAPFKTTD